MNKIFITTFIFILTSLSLLAQEKAITDIYAESSEQVNSKTTTYNPNFQNSNQYFESYWGFGGSLGFSFWSDGTDILIAPKAFYNISPILKTGFGLTYIYSDYETNFSSYKNNSFGGSLFFAVRPINFIQISAEYEGLQTYRSGTFDDEYWNNSIYLGLSLISGRVSFGLRYDVLYDNQKSPYSSAVNPVIGFYF